MAEIEPRESKTNEDMIERTTLCVASSTPGVVTHHGDSSFLADTRVHFSCHENNAAEQLMLLKARLAESGNEDFWNILLEGIATITGSQYALVVKRILVDDQNSAVEMPELGEPGSCLMAVAVYYSDGAAIQGHIKDYKYTALAGPCSYMKHDKVFMIPDGLETFISNNPGGFAFPVESYLGLPLFSNGKCFAHFAGMWSQAGLDNRKLSWGFIEMVMHSLEDMVTKRLVDGQSFSASKITEKTPLVIPNAAISAVQSLKPYARSLSHELRTPMQGVIGMLEIMYANVQEALDGHPNAEVEKIFKLLRDNIETVQGKRAESWTK